MCAFQKAERQSLVNKSALFIPSSNKYDVRIQDKSRQPAYKFSSEKKLQSINLQKFSLDPGQYDIKIQDKFTQPAYKFSQDKKLQIINFQKFSIDPGQYEPDYLFQITKEPNYSFGLKIIPSQINQNNPGPGKYELKSLLFPLIESIKIRQRSKSLSLSFSKLNRSEIIQLPRYGFNQRRKRTSRSHHQSPAIKLINNSKEYNKNNSPSFNDQEIMNDSKFQFKNKKQTTNREKQISHDEFIDRPMEIQDNSKKLFEDQNPKKDKKIIINKKLSFNQQLEEQRLTMIKFSVEKNVSLLIQSKKAGFGLKKLK